MITPEEIRARAFKLWTNYDLHRAHLKGLSVFPWSISVARPVGKALTDDFSAKRGTLKRLRDQAKPIRGFGYLVEYEEVKTRLIGSQTFPRRIIVESLDDFLKLIDKGDEFGQFNKQASSILAPFPELIALLHRRPAVVLDYAEDWKSILAVCRYFRSNPTPGLYLRQLDIPGVDTKFIERRLPLLMEILDLVLPNGATSASITGLTNHGFERRYGLRFESPSIRFRSLDHRLPLNGLTDITAPLAEIKTLDLPIRRVFIIENKMNGLCFPDCPDSVAFFGLGYGAGSLREVAWLQDQDLFYWGDIDTHGFAILDQLRAAFPRMKSFLMSQDTLLSNRDLWGQEKPEQRFTKALIRLTPDENQVFNGLRENRWGEHIRLEQERVPFGDVGRALRAAIENSPDGSPRSPRT